MEMKTGKKHLLGLNTSEDYEKLEMKSLRLIHSTQKHI